MTSDFIVDLEIQDKRHSDLKSSNMERNALKNVLTRIRTVLNIVEVVTDASSSIIKMLGNFLLFL